MKAANQKRRKKKATPLQEHFFLEYREEIRARIDAMLGRSAKPLKKRCEPAKSYRIRSIVGRERVETYFCGDDPSPYLVIRTPIPHVPDWSGFAY